MSIEMIAYTIGKKGYENGNKVKITLYNSLMFYIFMQFK